MFIFIMAPIPREPEASEKTYKHIESNGKVSTAKQLPCWQDKYRAAKQAVFETDRQPSQPTIETPEVFISVIVPAYNEERRLGAMLSEAVAYLEKEYPPASAGNQKPRGSKAASAVPGSNPNHSSPTGWEILVVSDGSTDATISAALSFASALGPASAPCVRVVTLRQNRGKGGAVTHGLRHARGCYAVFADADGATRFSDLGPLVAACRAVEDVRGRGVAVGSRAHLVGSAAVVQRSAMRNFLMHGFHVLLRVLTPPATGRIKDTQCGFKLFSRAALGEIVPYMHSEGWIFDVEMLMLAEAAGIRVVECPVDWREIKGSKLNVVWDSLGMAWGLALLRAAWGIGVYKKR